MLFIKIYIILMNKEADYLVRFLEKMLGLLTQTKWTKMSAKKVKGLDKY